MEKFILKVMVYSFVGLSAFFLFIGLLPVVQSISSIQIINTNLVDQNGATLLGFMFCVGAIVLKKLFFDTVRY